MAGTNDRYSSIYQNLVDAGMDSAAVKQCMPFVKEENFSGMLPILSKHRAVLLDSIHTGQKQIDCLDYLIYKIRNKKMSRM